MGHTSALAFGLTWRAALHYWQSAYAKADEMLVEAIQLNAALRNGLQLLASLFFQGLVQGNQGRFSEALAVLNEALAMARRNGDAFWWPRLPNSVGWIYRELQDFERAADYDQQGLDVGREHAVLEAQANSLINLGADYTHAGDHDHTLPAFREVEDIFEHDAWFRWRYNIRLQAGFAEHWLKQGDTDQAEQFANRLRKTATEYEAWKYVAVAGGLLARCAIARGALLDGVALFETALTQLREHPCQILAWKLEAARCSLETTRGAHEQATAAASRASGVVRELAAQVEDDNQRTTFLGAAAVDSILKRHDA